MVVYVQAVPAFPADAAVVHHTPGIIRHPAACTQPVHSPVYPRAHPPVKKIVQMLQNRNLKHRFFIFNKMRPTASRPVKDSISLLLPKLLGPFE